MQWLPGDAVAGAGGPVSVTAIWDRDGGGPLPPLVVIGGRFKACGAAVANGLVTYEPVSRTWGTLGAGVMTPNPTEWDVRAITAMPNGDLVVGGRFKSIDGVAANNVARWNGASWSPLGTGVASASMVTYVAALTARPNGDVIAGGSFATAGGVAAPGLALWNGASWSAIGTLTGSGTLPPVASLATLPNGDVVGGGEFQFINGAPMNRIARWDGATWSALGAGVGGTALALLVQPNGDLIVGGAFLAAAGQPGNGIARWDGTSWSPLGSGMLNQVQAIARLPNGDLIAAGPFVSAGGVPANRIARFDGVAWSPLGIGITDPNGFMPGVEARAVAALPNGDTLVGGFFEYAGGVPAMNLARWDGASWAAAAAGTHTGINVGTLLGVHALARLHNGDLVAAGTFPMIGGVLANFVARQSGGSWSALGNGVGSIANAILELPNGDLVVGGAASHANGQLQGGRVSHWDGTTWSPVGADFTKPVSALAQLQNGDLVASGAFPGRIARFDGVSWQLLGGGLPTSLANDPVRTMMVLPNGDLVVSGGLSFGGTSYGYARWDGVAWTPMPSQSGPFGTSSFALLANGDLIAGGLTSGKPIERWDGVQWTLLAPWSGTFARAIVPLPDGSFVAVDDHTTRTELRRWNGIAWSQFAAPLDGEGNAGIGLPDGDLVVGGAFTAAGALVSAGIARLAPTCRAVVNAFGAGCNGSGGVNVFAAVSLPWRGATFRGQATGMPANGFALALTGFGALAVPLPSLLPQGGAGCFLLTTPDLIDVVLPVGGTAATAIAIPDSASLIGQIFHQQVVPLEFDPSGTLVAITASNRLTALIGSF